MSVHKAESQTKPSLGVEVKEMSEARLAHFFLRAIKYLFTTVLIIYFTKIQSENIYFKNTPTPPPVVIEWCPPPPPPQCDTILLAGVF